MIWKKTVRYLKNSDENKHYRKTPLAAGLLRLEVLLREEQTVQTGNGGTETKRQSHCETEADVACFERLTLQEQAFADESKAAGSAHWSGWGRGVR